MLVEYSIDHVHFDFLIEDVARMDYHDRSLGAEALAACLDDLDLILLARSIDESVEFFHDVPAVVGCTAGTAAYEDVGLGCSFSSVRIESYIDLALLSLLNVF